MCDCVCVSCFNNSSGGGHGCLWGNSYTGGKPGTPGFLLENITRGGKTQHRESLRGRLNSEQQCTIKGGLGACPPMKFLAFRSCEIDSDAIWANLGGKNRNHISSLFL